jgi:hypothetical protein
MCGCSRVFDEEEEEEAMPGKLCDWCDEEARDGSLCDSCITKRKHIMFCETNISEADAELERAQRLLGEDEKLLKELLNGTEEWIKITRGIPHRMKAVKFAEAGVKTARHSLAYVLDN